MPNILSGAGNRVQFYHSLHWSHALTEKRCNSVNKMDILEPNIFYWTMKSQGSWFSNNRRRRNTKKIRTGNTTAHKNDSRVRNDLHGCYDLDFVRYRSASKIANYLFRKRHGFPERYFCSADGHNAKRFHERQRQRQRQRNGQSIIPLSGAH